MISNDREELALIITSEANTDALTAVTRQVSTIGRASVTANSEVAASARAQQAEWNKDIALIQLKGRAVNVANRQEVNSFLEVVAAQRAVIPVTAQNEAALIKLSLAAKRVEDRVRAMGAAQVTTLDTVSPKVRTGAGALSTLAFAAAGAGGSAHGSALAFGLLADAIATTSKNARVASSAAGLGGLAIAAATVIPMITNAVRQMNAIPEGKVTESQRAHIQNLKTVADVQREIAQTSALAAAGSDKLGRGGFGMIGDKAGTSEGLERVVNLQAKSRELQARLVELRVDENLKIAEANEKLKAKTELQAQQASSLQHQLIGEVVELSARNDDAFARRRISAQAAYEDEIARVRELTTVSIDGQNQLIALAARRHRLTLEQIEEERTKRLETIQSQTITKGLDAVQARNDAEARAREERTAAEEKERKAEEDRIKAGLSGYQRMATAAKGYGSVVVAIAKGAAEAVRRFQILVQAKKDWLMMKSEWAAASASAATGNFVGAALHGVAAGGYAAAAAAGFAEAGGGGGGSGGGGAGSGGGASVFEPNAREGAGSFILQLITRDPYGRDGIAETQYQLTRAGALKRTIPIAPTTGLTAVGVH